MAFTNNRNVFYNNKSFDEKLFANGLGMGTPSFVCKGLELTGTTLTSGVFNNTGAFGILGLEGETHTIPANYTGFIVIKTTMNSQNGFNEIITSATKLDTDQRDTSNIKHFTIYELLNGVIVQDFRHVNYVKSFYPKNVGGNSFVWVINGFESEPFDASTLAGNRVLLNDYDINYDDSIHGASDLRDILLDIFLKAQTIVGNDKNFDVDFYTNNLDYNTNLSEGINGLIESKHGFLETPSGWGWTFRMSATTNDQGLTDENSIDVIKITVDNRVKRFTFNFEYDAFDLIALPMDEQGNIKLLSKNVKLDIGFVSNGSIYFNRPLNVDDLINYSVWSNGDFYITGVNGAAVTGSSGTTRFKANNTMEYSLQVAPYITTFISEFGSLNGKMYCGYNGDLTGSAIYSAENTAVGSTATVSEISGFRIDTLSFEEITSIRFQNSSIDQFANVNFNLTSNDNNKMISITPFTLFQLLQNNDTEVANIIYDNQFVSEAQKQEFEENGVTPLFHTLGEL